MPAWPDPAGFHRSSPGEWGGAQALGESWEPQVWAAVSPTRPVEGALGHLGEQDLPCSGCWEEPALPALSGTTGNAPYFLWGPGQPRPMLGSRRRPRPCCGPPQAERPAWRRGEGREALRAIQVSALELLEIWVWFPAASPAVGLQANPSTRLHGVFYKHSVFHKPQVNRKDSANG